MLDLTRLRVLAAVATHGSVTAAAKALHYSQPSVSHHLARLETETGAQLLQRVGRGVRLTPAGELLAQRAAEIAGRVDAAEAELAALVGLRTGRVRIAAFESALSVLVPPAARTLRDQHPGLDLDLTEAHPAVALQLLRAGEVDLAIVHGDAAAGAPAADGVRYRHLLDDPMYLLSTQPDQRLTDHTASTWIAGCVNCRVEFVAICERAGFTPRIGYSSDDIVVDQSLVAAGLGVTTMPGLALRSHHAPGVEASEIVGVRRRIHAATFGDPPDPPATAAFLAALTGSGELGALEPDAGGRRDVGG